MQDVAEITARHSDGGPSHSHFEGTKYFERYLAIETERHAVRGQHCQLSTEAILKTGDPLFDTAHLTKLANLLIDFYSHIELDFISLSSGNICTTLR